MVLHSSIMQIFQRILLRRSVNKSLKEFFEKFAWLKNSGSWKIEAMITVSYERTRCNMCFCCCFCCCCCDWCCCFFDETKLVWSCFYGLKLPGWAKNVACLHGVVQVWRSPNLCGKSPMFSSSTTEFLNY